MGSRRNDMLQALRVFGRSPGFAGVTAVVLAVGIGAAISIFTVFSALMLRPLPLPHPEQLVEVSGIYRNHARIVLSYPMFRQLAHEQRVFSGLCGWSNSTGANVETNGVLGVAELRTVTGGYYATLEERPLLGRLVAESDEQGSHAAQVAVIGYQFWLNRFAGDSSVVGKSFRIEGRVFTIIGVARPFSSGITVGDAPEITVPAGALDTYDLESRGLLWVNVTGRLRPEVSLEQARAQIQSFWPRLLEATVPTQSVGPRRQSFLSMGVRLDPASNGINVDLREKVQKPLFLLIGMVALILLVVCINLASLTLARASARRHEVSTRIALGATPWQAVRQSMMESVVLAFTGAAAGLGLAYWGSRLLVGLMTRGVEFPILLDLHPDWRVLCFAAGSAILTGALIGLVPAWKLSREHPALSMHGSQRTLGSGVSRMGKLLIVSQIAISLVLLQAAGLFLRNLQMLRSFHAGFEKQSLVEMEFAPQPQIAQAQGKTAPEGYRQNLAEAVASVPGVQASAFSSLPIPANGAGWRETVSAASDTDPSAGTVATLNSISPGFFRTLGIPVLAGRDFSWQDDVKHPRIAIIDSLLARQLFPSSSPIGKRIRFGVQPDFQNLEIVGVAQSARLLDIRDGAAALLYVPAEQNDGYGFGGNLLVHERASDNLDKAIGEEFLASGREYIIRSRSFEQRNDEALVYEQMTARLSSFFAAVALLVAAAGLFGLMSYAVTLRTREIGIRMALGSQRREILKLVLREAMGLTLVGIGIGIPCTLVAGHFVAHMLFELSSADPLTLTTTCGTLLLAGLAAGYLPARRAMKLEPMVALRQE